MSYKLHPQWGVSEMRYSKIGAFYHVIKDPDNMAPSFFARYDGWIQANGSYLLSKEGEERLLEHQRTTSFLK